MTKLRVFVSSTYYDLRHIRKGLESFIKSFGYESVLFESGDIAFHHTEPLDHSCYKEICNCHFLLLIIGGKYGSPTSERTTKKEKTDDTSHIRFYNSITKKEYETAIDKDLPVYIFIEKTVSAEYETYKQNRENDSIKYAHVDNVAIFNRLDEIYSQSRNNLTKDFETLDDITMWLRDQWSGLFAELVTEKTQEKSIKTMGFQLDRLSLVADALKQYSENLITKINPKDSKTLIEKINKDLRDAEIKKQIIMNKYMIHLIERHRGDMDEIIDIIKNVESGNSLYNKLNRYYRCTTLKQKWAQDEVNLIRKIFGVDLLDFSLPQKTLKIKRRAPYTVQQIENKNKKS